MPQPIPNLSTPVAAAAALALLATLTVATLPAAEASMPAPPPRPTPQSQTQFICQVPIEAARSVQVAHEEYFDCLEPRLDEWVEDHPEHHQRLQEQYALWKESHGDDLRDRDEAAQFVRDHPVDFDTQDIRLSSSQVERLMPTISAEPVLIPGAFERFFVDRASERLFLTTDAEGLVSIDASQRFAYEFEGSVGQAGGDDFFILDETTAVTEDPNPDLQATDLVILDISDREDPREIERLVGAIPNIGINQHWVGALPDSPPTFAQYRAIQEGNFQFAQCGPRPTVSTHPGQQCRMDGSCYRVEVLREPSEDGFCQRHVTQAIARPARPMPSRPRGRAVDELSQPPVQRRERSQASGMIGGGGGAGALAATEEAEAPAPARVVTDSDDGAMPQGGQGGAGSLSQMMRHGDQLFVLSAHSTQAQGWLTTFDISDTRNPTMTHLLNVDNAPEALQRHDNLLLIAGRDALVTASIATDKPRLLGERRQHCPVNYDPVVVEGAIAYRTIIVDQPRSTCQSRLEVIDLSQPHQPHLRTTRPIARPRGLAVLGQRLFVADEQQGIHIFDLTDPIQPRKRHTWAMPNVKDLVISDFDLFAMSDDNINAYFVAPLFEGDEKIEDQGPAIEPVSVVRRER